jgi:hypothetical protein
MHRTRRPILLGLALTLTVSLAACGGETVNPTATTGASTQPTTISTPASTPEETTTGADTTPTKATGSTAQPTTGGGNTGNVITVGSGNATVINATVTGGPHAGRYESRSAEATCSYGLIGADSWGNQFSTTEAKTGLTSLQLIVPSGAAAATGTSEFKATFTFGEMLGTNTTYDIEGTKGFEPKGSGRVTITGGPNNATVRIEAEPEPGVRIEATLQCNEVFVVNNPTPSATTQGRLAAAGIDLTITGGDGAGTFSVVGGEGTCGHGEGNTSFLTEGLEEGQAKNAWTVDWSAEDESATEGLTRFELLVPNTSGAQSGTDRFYLNINDQQYYYENLEGGTQDGTGRVTIQDRGDTGTVNIDVTLSEGRTIKGTVTCNAVTR